MPDEPPRERDAPQRPVTGCKALAAAARRRNGVPFSLAGRDESSSSASAVSQTLLGFLRRQRHLEWFTRESMHHLQAVVAVVPGSELAGGLMDVVLQELWT